jgi:hypothetical protein
MKQISAKKVTALFSIAIAAVIGLTACSKNDDATVPQPQSTMVVSSGDINAALAQFRTLLGDPLNSTTGQTLGRREINWDGVPASSTNINGFPLDFFNSTDPAVAAGRKRGFVLINGGTAFRVDSTDFADIDASYASQFDAFSVKKTFAYLANNVTQAAFKIAGTNTDASVKGFGVIFSDVDDANNTSIEYFSGDKSLGIFKVPARSAGSSFSFLGVYFPNEKVTKVKITCGNGILGAGVKDITDGGSKDLVVMDDFLYDEPKN